MIKWILLGISFLLFFGILGIPSFLLIVLFYIILKSLKKVNEQKDEEENDEKNIIKLDEIIKKESNRSFDVNKLETYKEIIYSGTQDEKIELIGMVVFNPSKEYVSLIRQMLKDNDETVRILASNSLQKMESFFENKIESINEKLKNKTQEKQKVKNYLELIKTYDKFIDSNLLESFIISDYQEKIFKTFKKINTKNADVKKSFLYLSVKYDRYEQIIDELKNKIETDGNINDKFLLAEVFYKQNKIELIQELFKEIKRKEIKNIKFRNSYDYWMNYAS